MGMFVFPGTIVAKGPILYWLDEISKSAEARERLRHLLDAIKKLAPTYQGLETAFDHYLAAPLHIDATTRAKLVEYLKAHWFSDAQGAYFPGQHVTQKYAEGVIKAIELSLAGKHHPVPITAWWLLQANASNVQMINLAEVDSHGTTTSPSVTLLLCTPVPTVTAAPSNTLLWGDAQAWVTEQQGPGIINRQIEKEARKR